MRRAEATSRVAAGAALAVAAAGFAPIVHSGQATRTSYELVKTVRTLDVLDGLAATAAPLWYLLPLAAALAVFACASGWHRTVATLAALVGLAALGLCWAVAAAPIGTEIGVPLLGGTAAIALAASAITAGLTSTRKGTT